MYSIESFVTMKPNTNKQLAAILFTDIEGFSKISSNDQEIGLHMAQIVPVRRHFQGLMGAGIPVGILILVNVCEAIGPEIDGVRTGRKAAVVLLRVLHLNGQGFPAPGGTPV